MPPLHKITVSLFLAGFCLACTEDYQARRLIDEAVTWVEIRPDSAQSLLEDATLLFPVSDETHARWCLLSGKAEDEMRKSERPKDLLPVEDWQRAKKYYDRHGTPEEQAQIHLYLGRAHVDANDYDTAADAYNEALTLAQKTDNFSLTAYINSYIADIYLLREYYPEALDKYREAAALHAKAGNLRSQALALRDCEYVFLVEEKYEQALLVLQQADSIARLAGDALVLSFMQHDYGVVYSELGEYDLAEGYLLNNIFEKDTCPTYLALSDVYIHKGDFNKARQCLERAYSDFTKDALPYQYYLLAKAEGNMDLALAHFERHQEITDSLLAEQNRVHVIEIEKKYDKTQLALAHNRLQMRTQKYLLAASFLALICVILFVLYRATIRRKNRKILEQKELLARKENEFTHLVAQLKRQQRLMQGREQENTDYLKKKAEVEALGESVFAMKLDALRSTAVGVKIQRAAQKVNMQNIRPLSTRDFDALEEYVRMQFSDIYAFFQERMEDVAPTYRHL
ncbi:MAG: hypothetical protein LBK07_06210, partial [Tannerella sp.]|nr:hypothetical protein [Tannerella sp.]